MREILLDGSAEEDKVTFSNNVVDMGDPLPMRKKMKQLNEIGEFNLIERIRKLFPPKSADILQSIGDDCAVIKRDMKNVTLISTDVLVEGVHFNLEYFTPQKLGERSAAVNISDIAAMGGVPKQMLLSLALPKTCDERFVMKFLAGIKKCSAKFNVDLIGGDLSSSKWGLFISVTIIGEARKEKFITRSGARSGESVYVTGNIGDSACGLELLLKKHEIEDTVRKRLISRHIDVAPRVNEGMFLAESGVVTAMLDLSDGIGSDLRRISKESGVGAQIYLDALPVSKELIALAKGLNKPVRDFALCGGEDYELLFTVKAGCEKAIESAYKNKFNKRIFRIGVTTKGKGVFAIDDSGNKSKISPSFVHFNA